MAGQGDGVPERRPTGIAGGAGYTLSRGRANSRLRWIAVGRIVATHIERRLAVCVVGATTDSADAMDLAAPAVGILRAAASSIGQAAQRSWALGAGGTAVQRAADPLPIVGSAVASKATQSPHHTIGIDGTNLETAD